MRIAVFMLVLLLLQVFTFGLGRSLQWLFAPVVGKVGRRWLMASAYLLTNGLVLGLIFRVVFGFGHSIARVMAFWMVLLLFVMYAALATFILYLLLRKLMAQPPLSRALRVFAPLFVVALLGLALHNAYTPVVRYQSITIDKKMDKPLRIGLASDTHLGALFGARQIDKLAALMNAEKVDMILLPGDVMDDNVNVYLREHMQPHLQKLRAPLGVYATMGNHDLFGDQARIRQELKRAGIRVLDNEVLAHQGLLIVGRTDDLDHNRPSTAALLEGQNTKLPVILLDHRPTEIEQHSRLPVDVQVSGHVHNGQIAPANLIVKALYGLAYGYRAIGNGHYFTTSGYGFWGVPLRLGSQSEIWVIDVKGR